MLKTRKDTRVLLSSKATTGIIVGLLFALPCGSAASVTAATNRESGISTGTTLLNTTDAELNYRLRDMRSAGARWVRVDFDWGIVQPRSHSEYKWRQYDRVVRAINSKHMRILATIAYTPVWARNVRCNALTHSDKCSPRSTEEYARFARALVLRYKNKGLHTWEIWNEPNLTGHWKTANADKSITVDVAAYARTANEAAREIKRYDAQATVITGGLAPLFESNARIGMRQSDFLAKLLPKLNRHYFTAVGVHPYSWPKMPGLAADYNAFYTVDNGRSKYNLRTIMSKAGWGDKPIWATEFGASTKGVRLDTGAPIAQRALRPDHVTETKQAQIIQDGVSRWYIKTNVGPIFVHSDSDRWLSKHKNENGFGLRRADNSKKPAYNAYRDSVQSAQ